MVLIGCLLANRTVTRLIAEMPEIGTLSNKAIAKLAGLAPIARDSGKQAGGRPVRGGREGVRTILFIVAEVVRKYDPDFRDCHQKLCMAGKPKSSSGPLWPVSSFIQIMSDVILTRIGSRRETRDKLFRGAKPAVKPKLGTQVGAAPQA